MIDDIAFKALAVVSSFLSGVLFWNLKKISDKADRADAGVLLVRQSLKTNQERLDHVERMQDEIHKLTVSTVRNEEMLKSISSNVARIEATLLEVTKK